MSTDPAPPVERRPGVLLMAALIVAPALSAWFLLWPGYSNGLRLAAFTWAAITVALALVNVVFG